MIGQSDRDTDVVREALERQISKWESCRKHTIDYLVSHGFGMPADLASIVSHYIFGLHMDGLERKVKSVIEKLYYELDSFEMRLKDQITVLCYLDVAHPVPVIQYFEQECSVQLNDFLDFLLCGFSASLTVRCGRKFGISDIRDLLSKFRLHMLEDVSNREDCEI